MMPVCPFIRLLFVFFVSGCCNQELLGHRNCNVCYVKLIIKSVFDCYCEDFLEQGGVF